MSKQININLSEEELISILQAQMSGPNRGLIAEAIMGVVESDTDRSMIFKAAVGIMPTQKFPIRAKIKIHKNEISTSGWDLTEMQRLGLLVDDYVLAEVLKFRPWKYYKYEISIRAFKNQETGVELIEETVTGERMLIAEEWPETLNTGKQSDDDLPF